MLATIRQWMLPQPSVPLPCRRLQDSWVPWGFLSPLQFLMPPQLPDMVPALFPASALHSRSPGCLIAVLALLSTPSHDCGSCLSSILPLSSAASSILIETPWYLTGFQEIQKQMWPITAAYKSSIWNCRKDQQSLASSTRWLSTSTPCTSQGTELRTFVGGQGGSLAISAGAACHILRMLSLLKAT